MCLLVGYVEVRRGKLCNKNFTFPAIDALEAALDNGTQTKEVQVDIPYDLWSMADLPDDVVSPSNSLL